MEASMKIERYKEIVDRLYSFINFPFSIIDKDYNTLYCKPSRLDHFLPEKSLAYLLSEYKKASIPKNHPYIYVSDVGIYIGIIPLFDSHFAFIGPVLSQNISIKDVASKYSKIFSKASSMDW